MTLDPVSRWFSALASLLVYGIPIAILCSWGIGSLGADLTRFPNMRWFVAFAETGHPGVMLIPWLVILTLWTLLWRQVRFMAMPQLVFALATLEIGISILLFQFGILPVPGMIFTSIVCAALCIFGVLCIPDPFARYGR